MTSNPTTSPTNETSDSSKLTRAEIIALVKQEKPQVNFSVGRVAFCDIDYFSNLRKRLKSFTYTPNVPSSIAQQVYNYLAKHKFVVFQLFTKGLKDHWITTSSWMQVPTKDYAFFTREAADLALLQLRASQPERKHKFLELYLTQAEYDKK